jgi:hypothetical protein
VQQTAFQRAALRVAGEDAPRATTGVIDNANNRIGRDFEGFANRTTAPADAPFLTDLQDIVDRSRLSMSADHIPTVERNAMNIIETAANNGGDISGHAYLALTKRGGPIDALISNPQFRQVGLEFRNALDGALQRHAAPEDVALLMRARAQWKALKTIEPLTLRADTAGGATPSTGDISPAALRAAVNKSYEGAARGRGGDLDTLARIGQRFLKEPPSSGTAERAAINSALGGLGGGGVALGGVPGVIPLAGTLAAGRAVNSVLRNQWLARNQVAASLNPNGFQFSGPGTLAAPFGFGAIANTPTRGRQ